ncbi:MAG: hypothetical protein ACWA5Q_09590 [bacterium]
MKMLTAISMLAFAAAVTAAEAPKDDVVYHGLYNSEFNEWDTSYLSDTTSAQQPGQIVTQQPTVGDSGEDADSIFPSTYD